MKHVQRSLAVIAGDWFAYFMSQYLAMTTSSSRTSKTPKVHALQLRALGAASTGNVPSRIAAPQKLRRVHEMTIAQDRI